MDEEEVESESESEGASSGERVSGGAGCGVEYALEARDDTSDSESNSIDEKLEGSRRGVIAVAEEHSGVDTYLRTVEEEEEEEEEAVEVEVEARRRVAPSGVVRASSR